MRPVNQSLRLAQRPLVAGILVVLGPMMIQSLTDLTRYVLDVAASSAPVNR